MSMALGRQGVRILGTTPEMIESSENRFKFSRMLDLEGVDQPKWKDCTHLEETKRFCAEVGYPCLVRPSFVLSGAGMTVVNTPTELETYLSLASAIDTGKEQRVVISKVTHGTHTHTHTHGTRRTHTHTHTHTHNLVLTRVPRVVCRYVFSSS
jgi:carbamoylphosphate synthase large subunit